MSSGTSWGDLSKELIVRILECNVDPHFREINTMANVLIQTHVYPAVLRALFKEVDQHPMRDSAVDQRVYALLSPASDLAMDEMAQLPSSTVQLKGEEFNQNCKDPDFVCSRIEMVFHELMHRSETIADADVRVQCQEALSGLHCCIALQAMRHFENRSLIAFVDLLGNKLSGTFKQRIADLKDNALYEPDETEFLAHAFRELLKEHQVELNGIQYLDLSQSKLTSLPPEIGMLKGLVILDLGRNKITRLPSEIAELKNLVRLTLSNNLISDVPVELSLLPQLRELYLDSNKLQKVPEGVLALNAVGIVNLNSNQINEMPESISQMKGLSELHVANNKIPAFPDSLGDLQNLRQIDARNNLIEKLPDSFRSLESLEALNLTKNKLVEYPVILQSLPHLTDLKLDRAITERPAGIVRALSACAFACGSAMTALLQII
ncbi:MAG: leucine-rich repeat domain-containing protein [Verrucomicrobia bacterium]|nr:leucine-rich repeat domain-containing protein [Verrucomicrobiota bacterium]